MTRQERIREKKRKKCRRKYLKSNRYYPYAQEIFMWNLGCAILKAMRDPEFMRGFEEWEKERQGKE